MGLPLNIFQSIFCCFHCRKFVALLVTDPPHASFIPLQNQLFTNPACTSPKPLNQYDVIQSLLDLGSTVLTREQSVEGLDFYL